MLFLVKNLEIIDNIINKDIFYIDCFDKLKQLLWLNILSIFPPKKIRLDMIEIIIVIYIPCYRLFFYYLIMQVDWLRIFFYEKNWKLHACTVDYLYGIYSAIVWFWVLIKRDYGFTKNKCQIWLQRAETGIILIIFNDVLYHIHIYIVFISFTWAGTRKTFNRSMTK
jgi:hypothetical protein